MAGVPHPEPLSCASYSAVELSLDNDRVILLEQRELPTVERYLSLADCAEVVAAITDMVVRGAPAIGITAAYGMVVAAAKAPREPSDFSSHMTAAAAGLKASRPPAVNLPSMPCCSWRSVTFARALKIASSCSQIGRAASIEMTLRLVVEWAPTGPSGFRMVREY